MQNKNSPFCLDMMYCIPFNKFIVIFIIIKSMREYFKKSQINSPIIMPYRDECCELLRWLLTRPIRTPRLRR